MTVKELREIAKVNGVIGYSKMKKAELENALANIATDEMVSNIKEENSMETRKTTPGDGMMICSFTYAATMACAMRVITENEYDVFMSQIVTVNSLEEAYENVKLRKLIQKIPSVFQIRHEGCKGIVVKYPLEFVDGLKDKDLIITEGARKFASQNWEEAPLEVCNYLKKKDNWVALNPQFIQALKFENPNSMNVIVDYWFGKLEDSISDIAKAQEFHGIISSVDGASETNSNLVVALRNSSDLIDDFQIINWRKGQYEKFITDMKVGRILVPGEYTYMVCDPAYMINDIYGLNLNALKSGEYWFNDHVGYAGAFRSPLIAPFEAQKFNCVARDDFWYYKDIVIFNGFDGAWENMGGGDFDGDTCAIVPDNTDLGKIIVDGIKETSYVVWEKGLSAVEEEFSWDNMAEFNATVAKVDRTGVITNYASRAMDISNHLEATVYFAEKMNCVGVYMVHPQEVTDANKMVPHVVTIDGNRYFAIKGLVHATENKETRTVVYDENGIYGIKTFDEIHQIAKDYLAKVEYLRLMQGREIDSAKTGVAAEGVSGLDFVDSVKVEFTPQEMITRVKVLGRPVAKFAELNEYQSLSPLARIHDYVAKKEAEFNLKFTNGSDKVALLVKLLSKKEKNQLNMNIKFGTEVISLLDYIQKRKSSYNTKMSEIFKGDLPVEEVRDIVNSLKESEIESLYKVAENLNVSAEVIAVACYISAYNKESNIGSGLTYGWLLFNELISVFTRNNKKFELYRLPKYVDTVSIIDGYLYVNDKKHAEINADNCEYVPVQLINGKPYALIHKRAEKVTKITKTKVDHEKIYNIGMIYGFKYSIGSKDAWKASVKENGFNFEINFDDNSRLVTMVNGTIVGAIKTNSDTINMSDLVGHIVHITTSPNYSETDSTIKNVCVRVVK